MISCFFENSTKPVYLRHVVVDMLIIKSKQILLVKRSGRWLETGKWALPGGFININETGAEAAVRETREETGYQAKVIKLFLVNDNPVRPRELNRQNISLVYLLKPLKQVGGHDREVSQASWFDLDKLPPAKNFAFDHLKIIKQYLKKL